MKSGNICDLSNLDTRDLIEELENRGYMTGLLFCREDVETQLDSIREGYPGLELTMTDEDKDNILDGDIPTNWVCERINESLYDGVFNLFSEEINKWEEEDLGEKMRNGFGN
jgi:carbamoylphosphate synthase small subunit